jgi:DNA repair exonuclease SbcCD ATPase subunit
MRGFTCHVDTHLVLPAAGVVVVTGNNGSGKSSVVEAVSTALWGQTLRGTLPFVDRLSRDSDDPAADVGAVEVETDLVTARRRRLVGARWNLSWHPPGAEPVDFENTTKAQEALESVIGSRELWRRGNVFASADPANFTGATAFERLRLFETMLGADQFDDALGRARGELREATAALAEATRLRDVAQAAISAETRRHAEALETANMAVPSGDSSTLETKLRNITKLSESARRDAEKVVTAQRTADRAGGAAGAQAHELEAKLARLRGDTCYACGQAVTEALREGLRAALEVERRAARQARAAASAALAGIEDESMEAREELRILEAKRSALAAELHTMKATAGAVARAREACADAVSKLAVAHRAAGRAEAAMNASGFEVAELAVVDRVLGLHGVRAHIVSRALDSLEGIANTWLARLAPGVRLRIKPFKEKDGRGRNDQISVDVEGVGGGRGYSAASGGERRRIDVALLFAMGELSAAAHGRGPGTLFCDEVFDSLDAGGEAAVAAALDGVAADRAVVVITHSDTLADRLPAKVRWRFEGGRLV